MPRHIHYTATMNVLAAKDLLKNNFRVAGATQEEESTGARGRNV